MPALRLIAAALAALALAPAARAPATNVVLVTMDGLRWQEVFGGAEERLMTKESGVSDPDALRREFWRESPEARRYTLLPFMWGVVAREGQIFGNPARGGGAVVTNGHKFSYPGYNELLAGFADPRVDSNDKRPNPNVTVMEWLNGRPAFQGRVAAFCSWDTFPFILNRERSRILVNAGHETLPGESDRVALFNQLQNDTTPPEPVVRHDSFTFAAALDHLRYDRPRILYLGLGETDEWAHAGRYDLYLQAARRFDDFVGRLWRKLQATDGYAGRTALVLTTDHGRGDGPEWRNHGAKVAGAERIWIAVLGPATPARGEREGPQTVTQSQVAATVAALVGEDYKAAVPQAAPPLPGVVDGR